MRIMTTMFLLAFVAIPSSGCAASKIISTQTLLTDMTDLANLAEFPDPPYTCRQFSSYDRKSVSPEEDWFANADCGQYLRTEERDGRTEYVMMDADGPGAIVRIWSANPKGTLRIYLDHNDTPVLEAPMTELLGGEYPGIPEPLAGERSRGWNLYFPIPYARHCKVTSDEGGFYYHVNYRTYPGWAKVASFNPADLESLAGEIGDAASWMASPRRGGVTNPTLLNDEILEMRMGQVDSAPGARPKAFVPTNRPFALKPGEIYYPWKARCAVPAAIIGVRARVEAADMEQALRQLMLVMEFDGEQTVCCPLGDFFGATPGVNPYESLPLGLTAPGQAIDLVEEIVAAYVRSVKASGWPWTDEDSGTLLKTLREKEDSPRTRVTKGGEMWSHWIMPFRKSARVEVHNLGGVPVNVKLEIATDSYRWTRRSMHFHAQWRSEFDVPTRPMQDWNYVDIKGRGVFVGAAFAIANPVKTWWGEGDEKIYVDGETFPSHFGTGTEDYYGYAWCCNEPFMHAYHGQPRCDGPGNYGHTSVYRWHILDRIPFQKSFRFDMELWHWHDKVRVPQMSVVTYWYARPGATSNREPIERDDLRVVELPPYVVPRVAGALEGEEMRIVAGPGTPEPQGIDKCSNEAHMWWRDAQPGQQLVLAFTPEKEGKQHVYARFVKAVDYGLVQLAINGKNAGEPRDFYNDGVIVSEELLLGDFDLRAGENQISVQIVGAHEKAVKKYMFGLDYLRLEPAP
ncbi:MAG: glycoside hydrolase family 172 protein [Planctomycetota bacterium]